MGFKADAASHRVDRWLIGLIYAAGRRVYLEPQFRSSQLVFLNYECLIADELISDSCFIIHLLEYKYTYYS